MSASLGPRPDLLEVEPYISPQLPARYRMNTNESPYPPPPEVVDDIARRLRTEALNRYPDRDATLLFEVLARHTGRAADRLWIANGSNEVFLHLFLAFGGPRRMALVFEPTYSLHRLIPRIAGTGVVTVPRGEDLLIDIDRAGDTVRRERPEIVVVCSPNNPTGLTEPRASIEDLLDASSGLVAVDEAYVEFAPDGTSVIDLVDRYENLVVVRTLSKAWRLAGVRLGYLVASPAVVADLRRVRLPYHLSTFTQLAGIAMLEQVEGTRRSVEAIRLERNRIAVELHALGVKSYPSEANFVLFEVDDADAVWDGLLARGVLVRSYDGVAGLDGCLRVTAGLPEETDAFLDAMREVVRA